MKIDDPYRAMLFGVVLTFGLAALLIGFVFATGGTFGQRCAKAFPDDPARAELCVYNLSHGERP